MFSLFRYFAFVISLCRLRYFVMSPSLFRLFVFSLSSFRLFAFVFSSFRYGAFVMSPRNNEKTKWHKSATIRSRHWMFHNKQWAISVAKQVDKFRSGVEFVRSICNLHSQKSWSSIQIYTCSKNHPACLVDYMYMFPLTFEVADQLVHVTVLCDVFTLLITYETFFIIRVKYVSFVPLKLPKSLSSTTKEISQRSGVKSLVIIFSTCPLFVNKHNFRLT